MRTHKAKQKAKQPHYLLEGDEVVVGQAVPLLLVHRHGRHAGGSSSSVHHSVRKHALARDLAVLCARRASE
jgi:hypothetical protein